MMDDVRSWMSSPAIVAAETMPLPQARQMLQERRIRRVPVVDADGRLAGIVSIADLALAGKQEATAQVVKQVSEPGAN